MTKGAFKIGMVSLILALFTFGQVTAQNKPSDTKKKELQVPKYTVMEKFEPELVISVEERMRLKEERRQMVVQQRKILDTMNISDRRRSRLLKELNRNPFSDRINRAFADIKFEDDDPDTIDQNK